ncbi:hypothetical protein HKX48_005089 [Thoreauomyces humboldtii]|nr:hypothetical protein HKX48_005089 [Thoreauomyces humboldtii]
MNVFTYDTYPPGGAPGARHDPTTTASTTTTTHDQNPPPLKVHVRTSSLDSPALQSTRLRNPSPLRPPSSSAPAETPSSRSKTPEPKSQTESDQVVRGILEEERTKSPASLNLSDRALSQLPPEIGLLVSLERLGLSNNLLASLPVEIVRLSALRYLNLRSNQIRDFPTAICGLGSLEILDLSRNKMRKLPPTLGALMNLKVLSLARNRLQQIPTYVGRMSQLKVFKLEHNPLSWPPPGITQSETHENHEVWVQSFKEYLLAESVHQDAFDNATAAKRLGDSYGHDGTPTSNVSTEPSSGSRYSAPTRALFGDRGSQRDCYVRIRAHIRKRREQEVSSAGRLATGLAPDVEETACALEDLAYPLAYAHRIVNALLDSLDTISGDVLFTVRSSLDGLNAATLSLVACLGRMFLEPVPVSPTGLTDGAERTLPLLAELRSQALSGIAAASAVVRAMQSATTELLRDMDLRDVRSFLAEWHCATSEIATALQGFMSARHLFPAVSPAPSSVSFLYAPGSTTSDSDTGTLHQQQQQQQRFVADWTTIRGMAQSAATAATEVLKLLKDIPGSLSREKANAVPDALGAELLATMVLVHDSTKRISDVLAQDTADLKVQRRVAEESGQFVKAITNMSAVARTLAKAHPLEKSLMVGLHSVTRTTKELAMALATLRTGITTPGVSEGLT